MCLPEDGQKCGRNMQAAYYVYNIRLYAFVGFIIMSNELNAWSWMVQTLTLLFSELAKERTSTEMVNFLYVMI